MDEWGPRNDNGAWCVYCGIHHTSENGLEVCPADDLRNKDRAHPMRRGMTHLWAYGQHNRAMSIWKDYEKYRAQVYPHQSAGGEE
jgi:hypothetical protein